MILKSQVHTACIGMFFMLSLASNALFAMADAEQNPRFIERNDEGWFFYEPIPEEPEEEEIEPVKPPVAKAEPPEEEVEPIEIMPEGPAVFSVAWIRENLPKYMDAALDNPTIENVKAYYYLQRLSMDKAEQFADAAEMAVVGDPFLDEISRRPTATFASFKVDRYAGIKRGDLIDKIAENYGLFYFFQSDCVFCIEQAPIIQMLRDTNKYTVVPVSTDGIPYLDRFFDNVKVDAGQAKTLNIQTYPAIFLVSQDGEFEPVGQGVMSLPDVKNRILIAAKRRGWITGVEYNKTKPAMNLENNIAAFISAQRDSEDRSNLSDLKDSDNNNFVDPGHIVEFFKKTLRHK